MKPYLSLILLLTTALLHAAPEYTAYRLQNTKELSIDGDLSDWPELPILLLGNHDQIGNGNWTGPADSHAKIRMTWDDRNLYMAIEVTDDMTVQNFTRDTAFRIHSQDAIQWAVDLSDDGGLNYGDDNYEYGFSVVEGEPLVYRWYSSSGWPVGIAEHIKLAAQPNPQGGVIYEAAVDWSMLAPLRNPEDGRQIGFSIVMQDRDDGAKKTLQWTPGIATGKRPSSFGKLIFSHAAPSMQGSSLLISANAMAGADGLDLQVISAKPEEIKGELTYQLVPAEGGDSYTPQPLAASNATRSDWQTSVPTKDIPAGDYRILISDESGETLATHTFTRGAVEKLQGLIKTNSEKADALAALIEQADKKGIQTRYQLSALTAARLFAGYIQEDLEKENYRLALHNAAAIETALNEAQQSLNAWMNSSEGVPELLRVPDYDYGQTKIDGREFVIDGKPVMLIGPLGWLWSLYTNGNEIADIGYNTMVVGWSPKHHFDKKGRPVTDKKLNYGMLYKTMDIAKEKKMAFSISALNPDKTWDALEPRGEMSMSEFHELYDKYASDHMPRLQDRGIMNYNISTEAKRAKGKFDPKLHQTMWTDYLRGTYTNIDELNQLYGSDYTSFDEVPFPESLPANPAQKYDYTRLRQIIIGQELTRTAETIRSYDEGAIIRGYPYVWAFRDPAAYYQHAIDPELDMESWDIAGCDTSGPLDTDRYAMATVNWIGGYYDLMRSIAHDRPLCDGEFHFSNRRKIYPDNWTRAIYFHAYMHGLNASYSWVWARADLDAALLLDANVLLGSGRASLDLQRTAPAIAAFQEQPNDVVLLFANASSPHSSRSEDGLSLSQMSQADRIYEGIFFEGMQVGFITGSQIKDGLLDKQKLLIVPNSSHVEKDTREGILAFAKAGGRVVLVGESLKYTPQGADLPPLPELPGITHLKGFADVDEARTALAPILKEEGVLPELTVKVDNGLPYPTVEWRRATDDDGNPMLFVLNLGHDKAQVTLPDGWDDAVDIVANESVPADFTLDSLQFRILKK